MKDTNEVLKWFETRYSRKYIDCESKEQTSSLLRALKSVFGNAIPVVMFLLNLKVHSVHINVLRQSKF